MFFSPRFSWGEILFCGSVALLHSNDGVTSRWIAIISGSWWGYWLDPSFGSVRVDLFMCICKLYLGTSIVLALVFIIFVKIRFIDLIKLRFYVHMEFLLDLLFSWQFQQFFVLYLHVESCLRNGQGAYASPSTKTSILFEPEWLWCPLSLMVRPCMLAMLWLRNLRLSRFGRALFRYNSLSSTIVGCCASQAWRNFIDGVDLALARPSLL